MKTNPDDRFFSYVEKSESCWIWSGGLSDSGYGVFWVNGRSMGAHRYSLLSVSNHPEDKKWALHKCDNKRCVNPEHLYWGDRMDNTFDAVERCRMAKGKSHGSHTIPISRAIFEKNGFHKLTREDVLKIRTLALEKVHKKSIAELYEINLGTVYRAIKRADALISELNKEEK